MIKILQNQLVIDETVLKYATDEEVEQLRNITKSILQRLRKESCE